jgi:metal-responsive CopG/Arc/MetJ family transcriptional regulator
MKTAISLPDGVYREAERYARRQGKSRSQLYAEAITEYLARHASDSVTEMLNKVWDELGYPDRSFTRQAAKKILGQESW